MHKASKLPRLLDFVVEGSQDDLGGQDVVHLSHRVSENPLGCAQEVQRILPASYFERVAPSWNHVHQTAPINDHLSIFSNNLLKISYYKYCHLKL
jgi:hypothetical protein